MISTCCKEERVTNRQAGRDRQTDNRERQTGRQAGRQTDTDGEKERDRDGKEKERDRQTDRQRQTETERDRERKKEQEQEQEKKILAANGSWDFSHSPCVRAKQSQRPCQRPVQPATGPVFAGTVARGLLHRIPADVTKRLCRPVQLFTEPQRSMMGLY